MDSEPHPTPARNCPCCNDTLVPVGRHGVQIDRCPGCGGVWLDRGELEKIMERSYRNRAHGYCDDDDDWLSSPSENTPALKTRHVA
ncbi:MAG: zf-TFIIB domain-containing protein [Pirellula sp.]|jgi:Zn-finger nucleic acid-binding protein|nr:zf-TFIIB domain-containing protein [Pirellula sp.]